jgi:glycosyltransferase involved in cell wall biosynthesis
LIDAQLAYPEGWAARLLAILRNVPYCITARGHDVNHLPEFPVRGMQVRYAVRGAGRVMAVAEALRRCVISLGCPEEKTETIPNGVDVEIFRPIPREDACARLKLDPGRRHLVSVGHLVERKGHHILIEALALLKGRRRPVPTLAIVGSPSEEGDYSTALRGLISRYGLEERVILVGEQPPEVLPYWYSAADALCLASSKEGWANVLLESLACGTPVIGTRVWGTPEVICHESLGILVERDAESFAAAFETLAETPFREDVLVRHASKYTWERSGMRLVANYRLAHDAFFASNEGAGSRSAGPPRDSGESPNPAA